MSSTPWYDRIVNWVYWRADLWEAGKEGVLADYGKVRGFLFWLPLIVWFLGEQCVLAYQAIAFKVAYPVSAVTWQIIPLLAYILGDRTFIAFLNRGKNLDAPGGDR